MFELRLQSSKLLLGKNEIGIVFSSKRSHAFNLHLLGHHLGAQDSGGFNQGSCLTINLQNASGLFVLVIASSASVSFSLACCNLLFKEQPAPRSLGNRQRGREFSEFFHPSIGQLSSPLRVAVFDRKADQPILGPGNSRRATLQLLSRIRHSLFVIFLHQAKALDHCIFDGPAGQQGDVHIGRVLESKTPASQRSQRSQRSHASQLPHQCRTDGRILLRRKQHSLRLISDRQQKGNRL